MPHQRLNAVNERQSQSLHFQFQTKDFSLGRKKQNIQTKSIRMRFGISNVVRR